MSGYKYSFKEYNKESMGKALGSGLPISTKQSIEICNMIRGMSLVRAKKMLNDTIEKKAPVPFRRFTNGVGHRKGNMAAGRYPGKASENILSIIESAEKNAQQKGLSTSKLRLVHISAQKAAKQISSGRHRGRTKKNTHIEVVVGEISEKEGKTGKKEHKEMKKDAAKAEKAGVDAQKNQPKDKEAKEGGKK